MTTRSRQRLARSRAALLSGGQQRQPFIHIEFHLDDADRARRPGRRHSRALTFNRRAAVCLSPALRLCLTAMRPRQRSPRLDSAQNWSRSASRTGCVMAAAAAGSWTNQPPGREKDRDDGEKKSERADETQAGASTMDASGVLYCGQHNESGAHEQSAPASRPTHKSTAAADEQRRPASAATSPADRPTGAAGRLTLLFTAALTAPAGSSRAANRFSQTRDSILAPTRFPASKKPPASWLRLGSRARVNNITRPAAAARLTDFVENRLVHGAPQRRHRLTGNKQTAASDCVLALSNNCC
jgi:hypothetical protein